MFINTTILAFCLPLLPCEGPPNINLSPLSHGFDLREACELPGRLPSIVAHKYNTNTGHGMLASQSACHDITRMSNLADSVGDMLWEVAQHIALSCGGGGVRAMLSDMLPSTRAHTNTTQIQALACWRLKAFFECFKRLGGSD